MRLPFISSKESVGIAPGLSFERCCIYPTTVRLYLFIVPLRAHPSARLVIPLLSLFSTHSAPSPKLLRFSAGNVLLGPASCKSTLSRPAHAPMELDKNGICLDSLVAETPMPPRLDPVRVVLPTRTERLRCAESKSHFGWTSQCRKPSPAPYETLSLLSVPKPFVTLPTAEASRRASRDLFQSFAQKKRLDTATHTIHIGTHQTR